MTASFRSPNMPRPGMTGIAARGPEVVLASRALGSLLFIATTLKNNITVDPCRPVLSCCLLLECILLCEHDDATPSFSDRSRSIVVEKVWGKIRRYCKGSDSDWPNKKRGLVCWQGIHADRCTSGHLRSCASSSPALKLPEVV